MRIVQLITRSDNIGGAQVHVKGLAQTLINKGCQIHVFVGGNGPFLEDIKKEGLSVTSIPSLIRPIHPYYDWRAFLEIRRLLKKVNPDVVAVHSSKAGLLGRLAAKSLRIPVVFTAHGWAFTEGVPTRKRKLYIAIEKFAGLFASKIITVSNYDYQLCMKHRVVQKQKLVMIHNGIEDLSEEKLRQLPRNISPFTFVMTARLEEPKNHTMLLKALSQLQTDNWKVLFIGDGPLRSKVEDLVIKLNLTKNVQLLGERFDVEKLLKKSSCFLLISDWEGLPISVIEAMRAGLPIIASDVGGVSELIEEGGNGFLIPRGNLHLLIERLTLLLSDPIIQKKMGSCSRKNYERHFQIERMVNETLAVYYEAIHAQGKNESGKANLVKGWRR